LTISATKIANNYRRVCERVERAARAAGRDTSEITIVGVTKYVGIAETRALIDAGCHHLGESRPQSLWEKHAALASEPIQWHMIGHLQRNKVRRTLPLVSLFHSLDSMRLAEELNTEAAHADQTVAALVEVNVSGDATKHGFAAADVGDFLAQAANLERLRIRGLMCMAALGGDDQATAANFASLRMLRDELAAHSSVELELPELSMGMSGDFETAIHQGATLVRVGSILFEE
jgi:pyridoxal phosphate enzyme (YggS family)